MNDLRFALRMLRRTPLFTAAVVLTVALAIAANTAIFSVVHTVLLRPLPFRDPDRLVQVAEKNDKLGLPVFAASVLNFLSWREQTHAFEELAATGFANFTLTGKGDPEQLSGNRITANLPRVLGTPPLLGRGFSDDEEKTGGPPVALIGEGLWKRRFGGDPAVVGSTLTLDDVPTTIVGIAPAGMNLLSGGEVYVPLRIDPSTENRLSHVIFVTGRLAAGVTVASAQAEMDTIAHSVGTTYPEVHDWGINLVGFFDTFVSPPLQNALWVLLCAVVCVLLIACANIANLMLARATARQSEIAVRSALGASRARLTRQLLTESLLLSGLGGAAGLLGAYWLIRLANGALPPNLLPVPRIAMDPAVLMFAVALTLAAGILFGLAPAWRLARTADLQVTLKQAGRGSAGGFGGRLRSGLSAAEIALATILLIGAGLLIRSFANLEGVRLGFEPHGMITFQLSPPQAKYSGARAAQMYGDLIEALRSAPGVRAAVVSSGLPFGNGAFTRHPMLTTSASILPPETLVPIDWRVVNPGYFRAMNIPLLRGRDFTDADGPPPAQPIVIVSQATARRFWGDEDPIGRTLVRSADRSVAFTVVGVVGDIVSTALNQELPTLYYPIRWRVWPVMDVGVRTDGSPEALLPTIRQKVRQIDPDLALANIRTLEDWIAISAAQPRLNAVILGGFAGVALLIAALGIYGVLAYSVGQRTREIGLRMALGADRGSILRLIVVQGMKVSLIGIAVGLSGSFLLARALASLVYGVDVRDPLTFVAVACLLLGVALAACAVPARRAARVDPLVALRQE